MRYESDDHALLTAARSIGSLEEEDSDLTPAINFAICWAWALGISSIVYGVILIVAVM